MQLLIWEVWDGQRDAPFLLLFVCLFFPVGLLFLLLSVCFIVSLFVFQTVLHSLQDLSSPARDFTQALGSESKVY